MAPPATSRRMRAQPTEEDVLAAVIELSTGDSFPSTSLITSHLTREQADGGAVYAGVHAMLRHLEAAGRVARVTSQGTHRWSPGSSPRARVQPATHATRERWTPELPLGVALAYVVVVLVFFAAGYAVGRLFL